MNTARRFLSEEDGATAIEYGLIAALIAVAIIGVLGALTESISANFQYVADKAVDVID